MGNLSSAPIVVCGKCETMYCREIKYDPETKINIYRYACEHFFADVEYESWYAYHDRTLFNDFKGPRARIEFFRPDGKSENIHGIYNHDRIELLHLFNENIALIIPPDKKLTRRNLIDKISNGKIECNSRVKVSKSIPCPKHINLTPCRSCLGTGMFMMGTNETKCPFCLDQGKEVTCKTCSDIGTIEEFYLECKTCPKLKLWPNMYTDQLNSSILENLVKC